MQVKIIMHKLLKFFTGLVAGLLALYEEIIFFALSMVIDSVEKVLQSMPFSIPVAFDALGYFQIIILATAIQNFISGIISIEWSIGFLIGEYIILSLTWNILNLISPSITLNLITGALVVISGLFIGLGAWVRSKLEAGKDEEISW